MGKYEEKIKEHFWLMIHTSTTEGEGRYISDAFTFKEAFESGIKIDSKGAIKLVEDQLWATLYAMISETQAPEQLRVDLESVVQVDSKAIKEDIWKILVFSVTKTHNARSFKKTFQPGLKINTKKAIKLVEDHLWTTLYDMTCEAPTPEELREKLASTVKINVRNAALIIKEKRPEKFEILQLYK